MFCLYTSSKLYHTSFEFLLKMKVMGSNTGYLLKSFLFYLSYKVLNRRTHSKKHPGMFIRNPTVLVGTTSTTNSLAMWWQNLWPLMAANLHDTRLFSFFMFRHKAYIVERLLPSREEESTIMYGEGRKKSIFYYVW